jgi:hypothetical protein
VKFSADLVVAEVFESVECELVLMDLKGLKDLTLVQLAAMRIVSDLTREREA